MEVYKDLLTLEKSKYKIVLGILFIILSIARIIIGVLENENISALDWFFFGAFALNGIVFIAEGKGFSSSSLFGKAYLLINDEKILIKMRILDKERTVSWSEIKSIRYGSNNFDFEIINSEPLKIKLSKFNYSTVQKIKEIVTAVAKENNIRIKN